jgi:hypothetical protein
LTLFGFGKASAGGAEPPPLTKQDYAHTTGNSPDSTSLIPALRNEPIGETVSAPTSASTTGRTRLRLVRVEPYSVTRLAFVVSVALMIVTTVAAAIFWLVLSVTGVWGEINASVASLLSDDSASFDIRDYLGFTRMVGGTLVVSGINVILMTALATVGAHLYNLASALLGGVEATFTVD